MRRLLPIYILVFLIGCEDPVVENTPVDLDLTSITYEPKAFEYQLPIQFPIFEQPDDNQMTEDGVELGRHLFYDPILSRDSLMSCSSCHLPSGSFTDNLPVSKGVDQIAGTRSSMSLLNVGFHYRGLMWDGRVNSLEEQALLPVEDPIELHTTWPEVIDKIQRSELYPEMYRKAFGISNTNEISKELTAKALAQFERSLISSGKSKFDRVNAGLDIYSPEEQMGFEIFFDTNLNLPDGQCFHCHDGPLLTTNEYNNNGLDEAEDWGDFEDLGLGGHTGNLFDNGKFRVPTLRNIEFSAPYMHDGRFNTLEEVMDHYNSGGFRSKGKSTFMDSISLTTEQTAAVIAFLKTLSDPDFNDDPKHANPFE